MRVKWEENDIKVGRYIIKESSTFGSTDISFAASVTYKIGFLTSRWGERERYVRIAITDGMTSKGYTQQKLADILNENEAGFRPLTQSELIDIISHLEKQNTGGC